MKGFNLKFLEELKSKNDIVEVIGGYVPLTRRGSSFWGKCPFHHEKTASFCVNGTDQFYYCFGCHKSGDVISFIMEIENVDFADAVKILAQRAGMQLPELSENAEKTKALKQKKDRLFKVVIPEIAPEFIRAAGAGLSLNIKLMVAAEVLSQTANSMGYLLNTAKIYFEISTMIALVLFTVAVGLIVESVFRFLSKKAAKV